VSAAATIASGAVTTAKLGSDVPVVRAWVNFNATLAPGGAAWSSGNVLINAGYNVASVLRNGTGDYTITFTSAISDANYAFWGSMGRDDANNQAWVAGAMGEPIGAWKKTASIRISLMQDINTELAAAPYDVSLCIVR
jgi:hypothetical protein